MTAPATGPARASPLPAPHALAAGDVLARLGSTTRGLGSSEAAARLATHGPNALPQERAASVIVVFGRQFLSPFIYVLLFATALSVYIREWADAGFIAAVLLLNATIGTVQEHRAEHSALALRRLVSTRTRVIRDDDVIEIPATELVPGDVVLLASGDKVPADARLLESAGLLVDESMLTGESHAVEKDADRVLPADSDLADRVSCAFAGTLVTHGRGVGVVTATGVSTQVGRLAGALVSREENEPPLVTRMRQLTLWVAAVVAVAAVTIGVVESSRGASLDEALLLAVALAVSAIPEGLPVALTVALAIGMARMARRNVIVRRLVAVEALGSCTVIASDKTGTLTVNELTVTRVALPGCPPWEVTGAGAVPAGRVLLPDGDREAGALLERLARAAVLCNEGTLARRNGDWVHHGDAVDVALLVLAHKLGLTQAEALAERPVVAMLPYEPERRFAASLHAGGDGLDDGLEIAVKGAAERVLGMCDRMATRAGDVPLDARMLTEATERLAGQGHRVLAVAAGPRRRPRPRHELAQDELSGLTFLGLLGMIDPIRPDARESVAACRRAGVQVDMVTGDHPITALAIARDLGLAEDDADVVTGRELREATERGEAAFDELVARARVFARVEPEQKLQIVRARTRAGHIVAVTGDGANDAPALRQAHVGAAMGAGGTDVAREAAELVVTDDAFASVAAGIEEGRIAYGNVRKVVQLLVATGAGEVALVLLAVATGVPLPVVAVQLLWLNLVTNGIQDVALAFEPAEGDEMRRRPRPPTEPVFNRLMVERVLLVAVVMGALAFGLYQVLLGRGWQVEQARNSVVLLLVLFENVLALSARSETRSLWRTGLRGNRILVVGVAAALLVHLAAMHLAPTQHVLDLGPVPAGQWPVLIGLALVLLLAVEAHKYLCRKRRA